MISMIIQAITWWLENDEPVPDVMAEHILYLLGQGLPGWLLACFIAETHGLSSTGKRGGTEAT